MNKKKMIMATLVLALSLSVSQSAFAATTETPSNDKAAKQAQNVEWKAATEALKTELLGLRSEQKALSAQIKTVREANKEAHKALSAEEKAALKESLTIIKQQIKAQHSAILVIRSQKQALFMQVKAEKKAGNYAAGIADLEQIIQLKEQIIQIKQSILVLQQSLQSALSTTV
ncbi:MAG: hypothetical protein H7X86_09910 [Gorillibacterium sp.]|nr:hypothetical protein [Gorillibacterium sp.]